MKLCPILYHPVLGNVLEIWKFHVIRHFSCMSYVIQISYINPLVGKFNFLPVIVIIFCACILLVHVMVVCMTKLWVYLISFSFSLKSIVLLRKNRNPKKATRFVTFIDNFLSNFLVDFII